MIIIPIHVIQNASAHMQTFLLLWQAEGQTPHNENKTKMATLSSHVTRRDTTMTPWPPHQACSFILEIYRESKFEKYTDRLLKQFKTEEVCVCVCVIKSSKNTTYKPQSGKQGGRRVSYKGRKTKRNVCCLIQSSEGGWVGGWKCFYKNRNVAGD